MAVNLMEVLPEYFRPVLEFQEIMKAHSYAMDNLEENVGCLLHNFFIQTCDEATLSYYERLLQIPYTGADLEERRKILLLHWNMKSLYTLEKLKEFLEAAVGGENYEVDCIYQEYCVRIWISEQNAVILRNLYDTIFRMIPAHIVLELYGRYLGKYEVPIEYENQITFQTEFYPRYNLGYLYLDSLWKLDGTRKLNEYDSDDYLDFYPVGIQIQTDSSVCADAELEVIGLKNDVSVGVECAGGVTQVNTAVRIQAEAEEQVSFGSAAALTIGSESSMINERYLDGKWKLDGSRKLDGGRYLL